MNLGDPIRWRIGTCPLGVSQVLHAYTVSDNREPITIGLPLCESPLKGLTVEVSRSLHAGGTCMVCRAILRGYSLEEARKRIRAFFTI